MPEGGLESLGLRDAELLRHKLPTFLAERVQVIEPKSLGLTFAVFPILGESLSSQALHDDDPRRFVVPLHLELAACRFRGTGLRGKNALRGRRVGNRETELAGPLLNPVVVGMHLRNFHALSGGNVDRVHRLEAAPALLNSLPDQVFG